MNGLGDIPAFVRRWGGRGAVFACVMVGGCTSGNNQPRDAALDMTGADVPFVPDAGLIDSPAPDATPDVSGGSGGATGSSGGAPGIDASAGTDGSTGADRATGTGGAGGSGSGGSGSGGTPGSGGSGATAGMDGSNGADRPDGGSPTDRPPEVGDAAACGRCTAYGTPTMTGHVMPTDLANLSGIAVSWKNTGVLFAHNDMTQAHVFALAPDGRQLARFALTSAGAVDIEDVSVGPCPAGTCLYLADIGGNLSASRVEFSIYRITEPVVPAGGTTGTTNVTFEKFRFAYPDNANRNAEGLVVDPASGAIYVVTKLAAGQPSAVYGLPNPPSATALNTTRKVADLTVPRTGDQPATSASAHPCGLGFLLATNTAIYEFKIAQGAAFETAFAATPVAVPAPTEPQREAVSYRPDGRGYFSSGETASAPIFETGCP